MIDDFNKSQTKYTVSRQFIAGGGDAFTPRLANAMKGDQGPNVVLSDSAPASMGQLAATGKVVPLDTLLSSGPNPLPRSDFSPGMLGASTVNGKLYSLPTEGGDFAIIYNKQMFHAAGVRQTPTTWAEFAADAKLLTRGGTYGAYLPIGTGEWSVFVWEAMLASAGGQLLSNNNTKIAFDSSAGVAALTAWTNMVKDGSAYPTSLADSTQSQGLPGFAAKKVAMFVGNVYNIAGASAAIGQSNVGVFAFPKLVKPAMNLGTNVSFILKGTVAQQDGSWAFLSWFHQPAQQAKWAVASKYLPTNLQAQKTTAWSSYVAANPQVSVFAGELPYATTRPSIKSYAQISAALNTGLQQAMLGQSSPSTALSQAATQATSAMQGQG